MMAVATLSNALPKRQWSETFKNFWVDIALFLMFIVDMNTHLTGIAVHEWLGIVFGGALVYHLLLHWQWINSTTRRLFSKLPGVQRLRYAIDLLLFAVMVIVVASGVLISRDALPAVGLAIEPSRFWSGLHHLTSNLVILLVGLHLALSWAWFTNAWSRYLSAPLTGRKVGAHIGADEAAL